MQDAGRDTVTVSPLHVLARLGPAMLRTRWTSLELVCLKYEESPRRSRVDTESERGQRTHTLFIVH